MAADSCMRVVLEGNSADALVNAAAELGISPRDYLLTALNLASQIPSVYLACIVAGVPIQLMACANVGECGFFDLGDCGACDG